MFRLRAWHEACLPSRGTFGGRDMNAKAQLLWMRPEEEGEAQQRRKPLPDSWEAASTPESPRLLQQMQSQMWGFTTGTDICERCPCLLGIRAPASPPQSAGPLPLLVLKPSSPWDRL